MKTLQKNILILVLLIVAYGVVWAVLSQNEDGRSSQRHQSVIGSSSASSVMDDETIHMIMGDDEIDATKWKTSTDANIGITFEHPASYIVHGTAENSKTDFWGQSFSGKILRFIYGEPHGESPSIVIERTNDPLIVDSLTQYHPFEDVTVNGKNFKKFRWDGMLDPVGYLIQEKPDFVIITFLPGLTEQTTDRILDSIKVTQSN